MLGDVARASGGAGDGNRTRKGFRPETCEVSAFASFATPAPLQLRTVATPEGETQDVKRAADRWAKLVRMSLGHITTGRHVGAEKGAPDQQAYRLGGENGTRSSRRTVESRAATKPTPAAMSH